MAHCPTRRPPADAGVRAAGPDIGMNDACATPKGTRAPRQTAARCSPTRTSRPASASAATRPRRRRHRSTAPIPARTLLAPSSRGAMSRDCARHRGGKRLRRQHERLSGSSTRPEGITSRNSRAARARARRDLLRLHRASDGRSAASLAGACASTRVRVSRSTTRWSTVSHDPCSSSRTVTGNCARAGRGSDAARAAGAGAALRRDPITARGLHS